MADLVDSKWNTLYPSLLLMYKKINQLDLYDDANI